MLNGLVCVWVRAYELDGPFGIQIESVKCRSVSEWFECALLILIFVVTVAIIHDIEFHDIPFAKIISLSHDRVAALL